MDIAKLREYAKKKRDIKARMAQIKKEVKKLEQIEKAVLQMLTTAGVDGIDVGEFKLKVKCTLWAGAYDKEDVLDADGKPVKDYERACRALEEHGLGDFVKRASFNSQTLSAEIRRLDEAGELPEDLEKDLKIYEKFSVVVTKR